MRIVFASILGEYRGKNNRLTYHERYLLSRLCVCLDYFRLTQIRSRLLCGHSKLFSCAMLVTLLANDQYQGGTNPPSWSQVAYRFPSLLSACAAIVASVRKGPLTV